MGQQPHDMHPAKKGRKRAAPAYDPDVAPFPDPPKKKKQKKGADPPEEKRLRRWRAHAPQSYGEIRERAMSQRMFVLERHRDTSSNPDHPTETISLAGTTGNVYTIVIDKEPSCDCPHARKGNQCKHLVYVLSRVFRVRGDLEFQLAFLSSELRDIFANAPPLPSDKTGGDEEKKEKDGNRKPIEGECPICCVDFEPENSDEEIVFCKAACGNNIHKSCFQQWAATKPANGVTCPFCRTRWEGDAPKVGAMGNVVRSGTVNGDGYVNVADQLGLSGVRDYSSYHSYWVMRQARQGYLDVDERY